MEYQIVVMEVKDHVFGSVFHIMSVMDLISESIDVMTYEDNFHSSCEMKSPSHTVTNTHTHTHTHTHYTNFTSFISQTHFSLLLVLVQ